jgi:spore coat polysaccharide biosynthesis protein SpsF
MGSRRLPGKVLLPFGRRSILAYLVHRLGLARTLDQVAVATTRDSRDDAILAECEKIGIACFRGGEIDVLRRYADAARAFAADVVVRVTADNPFTDPGSIDRMVRAVAGRAVPYAIEDHLPVGTTGEALSADLLYHIESVSDKDEWREHVTLYAKDNLELVGGRILEPPAGLDCGRLRLTVDEMVDYLWAQEVRTQVELRAGPEFDLHALIRVASRLSAAA